MRLTDPHPLLTGRAVLVTLSNPLNLAVVGNPPRKGSRMARTKHRRRAHPSTRKGRHRASSLRSSWRKKTRKGGRYSHLAAVVRTKKNGSVRHGRRKHVKGHGWTGRKGTVALFSRRTGKLWGTNPRHRSRGRRFNPGAVMIDAKKMIVAPVVALPRSVPALFKGHMVKHLAYAAGGGVTGLVGGSMVNRYAMPLLAKLPYVSTAMANGIVQRVVGGSVALLVGGAVGRVAVKSQEGRNAWITGVAAAAVIEAIFPGRLAGLLARAPLPAAVTNAVAPAASPVQGLAGMFGTDDLAMGAYVSAPAYQGVGAYVEAPAYQGVGAYVEAPAYQGVGNVNDGVAGMGYAGEQLAGNLDGIGSNMMSHLDA